MKTQTTVPFGTMLRAFRLRWCYVRSRDCFVRVQDAKKGWTVELAPNKLSDLTNGSKGTYRVLDEAEAEKIFSLSPKLRCIRKVKRAFVLTLDDNGN